MARSTHPSFTASEATAVRASAAPEPRSLALSLLVSLRPAQWTKNLLVFAALIFAVKLFDPAAVARSIEAFAIFCVLSGVVYLINDVADRENDRRHPIKSRRPIAAGDLPVSVAIAAGAVLGAGALATAFVIGWRFGAVAAGYLVLQLLYSALLKHIVIMDVLALAIGF